MKIRSLRCIASASTAAYYRRLGRRALLLPARLIHAAAALVMSLACIAVPAASPEVILIPVIGAIGPASADFIVRGSAACRTRRRATRRAATRHARRARYVDAADHQGDSRLARAGRGLHCARAARARPAPAPISSMRAISRRWRRAPISARRRRCELGMGGAEPPGQTPPGLPGAGPAAHRQRTAQEDQPRPALLLQPSPRRNAARYPIDRSCASRSTTPPPISAASRNARTQCRTGPNARCAKR